MRIRRMLAVLLAASALLTAGCGSYHGNSDASVQRAIDTLSEQYGTEFKLRHKEPFTKTGLDFTVTCAECGRNPVHVFLMSSTAPSYLCCDYIYVRFGDAAYQRIRESVQRVLPESKIIVVDQSYNHFAAHDYGAETDADAYLLENDFGIYVYLPEPHDRESLTEIFHGLAETLAADGIFCESLYIRCMRNAAELKHVREPEHIPDLEKGNLLMTFEIMQSTGGEMYFGLDSRDLTDYLAHPDDDRAVHYRAGKSD